MKTVIFMFALIFSLTVSSFAVDFSVLDDPIAVPTPEVIEQTSEPELAPAPLTTRPQPIENCGDDSRLSDMRLFRDLREGKILENPLTMSVANFKRSPHRTIMQYGNNIIVCPDNRLIDGTLDEPVTVEWSDIMFTIRSAMSAGHVETLFYIQRNFRMNPVSGQTVIENMVPYQPVGHNPHLEELGVIPYLNDDHYSGLGLINAFGVTIKEDDPWKVFAYRSDSRTARAAAREIFGPENIWTVALIDNRPGSQQGPLLPQLAELFPTMQIVYED